jgi:hypothetical protein
MAKVLKGFPRVLIRSPTGHSGREDKMIGPRDQFEDEDRDEEEDQVEGAEEPEEDLGDAWQVQGEHKARGYQSLWTTWLKSRLDGSD